jgi:O-succinylbenzoic acid--CoA ligase
VVEPAAGDAVDLGELRSALEGELAPHELPRALETVESLPRTDSGTVDRVAVRSRFRSGGPDA